MAHKVMNILKNHGRGSGTKRFHILKQILACIASGLMLLSSGMAYGFTAVLLPELVLDESITYDKSYDSWVASILALSSAFACLAAGPIIDKFGRRCGLMLVIIPLTIGWILQAFAKTISLLLIGRFILGFSTGTVRPCALVYLGEIFDPKYRGAALISLSMCMDLGVTICHCTGNYVYWRICCFLFISPAVFGFLILLYLKESPIWYILKERVDEGIVTFKWFRGDGEASVIELAEVIKKQSGKAEITKQELIAFVLSKSFMKPLITTLTLFLSVQFLGITNLSFYATYLVRNTFSTDLDTFTMVLALDAIRLISSIMVCSVIDRFPRKITFVSFSLLACACVFSVAILLYLNIKSTWLPIVFMIGYVFFGEVVVVTSFVFLPEIFPGKVRGFASGLGSSINFTALFISVNLTPTLGQVYGQHILFIFNGSTTLLCTIILCFLLPETKGKTLQEIEDNYVNNCKGANSN